MKVSGAGTIERIEKNKHRIRFSLGRDPITNKYRQSPWRIVYGSKDDARRALEEYRKELEGGLRLELQNITFGEYAQQFINERKNLGSLQKATIETDKYLMRQLNKYLEGSLMCDIGLPTLKAVFIKLVQEDGISQSRLHDLVVKAKQVFEAAIDDNIIFTNPCKKIKAPKRPRPDRNSLSKAEAKRLFGVLDKSKLDRNIVAVYIGLATGMRRGEVLALRWYNIDFSNKTIYVSHAIDRERQRKEPKSEESLRVITIDSDTASRLKEWKALQKKQLAAKSIEQTMQTTVCGTDIGEVCDPDRFAKWFRSFCIKNGFACYVDENGNPLPKYRCNEKGVEVDENGKPFSRVNKKPRFKKFYKGLKYHELRHFVDINVLWSAPSLQGQIAL